MEFGTGNEISQNTLNTGKNVGSTATRATSSAVRVSSRALRFANRVRKQISKRIAKKGAEETVKFGAKAVKALAEGLKALLSHPIGWGILAVLLIILIIVCVDAHNPSSVYNYQNGLLEFGTIQELNGNNSNNTSTTTSTSDEDEDEDEDEPSSEDNSTPVNTSDSFNYSSSPIDMSDSFNYATPVNMSMNNEKPISVNYATDSTKTKDSVENKEEKTTTVSKSTNATVYNAQSNIFGGLGFLDAHLTEYNGDSFIGQPVKQYKEYFEDTFNKVFSEYCKMEVETAIELEGLDREKTLESYENAETPFKDINYAELICVMSQSPNFALYQGSLTEIQKWLSDINNVQYLYNMVLTEKVGSTELYSDDELFKYDNYPYDSTEIGTILEEKEYIVPTSTKGYSSLKSWFESKFDSPSIRELEAYAKEVGNTEFEERYGCITNNRTVIIPNNEKPKWVFRRVLAEEMDVPWLKETPIEITQEQFNQEYKSLEIYQYKDGKVYNKKTKTYVSTYEDVTIKFYKVKTTLVCTYIYGEVELKPYCLADLYSCFGIEPYENNVDHPMLTNIDCLNLQEAFLRYYLDDEELLGVNKRSDLVSANTALLYANMSEDNTMLNQIYNHMTSSEFGNQLKVECQKLLGTKYNSSFGGFSHFVCCNFVWYVLDKCGVEMCPRTLQDEDWELLGTRNKRDLRNSCTLQVYYYKKYQPQAIVSYHYNEGIMQIGDIVYIRYDVDENNTPFDNLPISEYSDHVYVYLGDGYLAENAGGSLNRVYMGRVSSGYKNSTFIVVRPSLLKKRY